MKKMDNFNNSLEKEDMIAVKRFLHRLARNSFWFILSIIIGAFAAFIITKCMQPSYQAKTLMLIKNETSRESVVSNITSQELSKKVNIQNHIGVLTSYSLNKQVLDDLDWATTWYKKDLFRDKELYGDTPFIITMKMDEPNMYRMPVQVSMIDSLRCRITIMQQIEGDNGEKTDMNISEIRKFGEPFNNKYFNFTVWRNQVEPKGNFYFRFNNPKDMVLEYTSKLNISIAENNSDLLNISLEDTDPQKAVDYLNELSKVFIQFGLIEKNRESASTVKFIDNQLSGVIDTLHETGQNFTNFRSQNQIINIGQEGDLIVQKLAQLETERSDESTRLEYYVNLYKYLNDKGEMKQVIAPSVMGITDAAVSNMVERLSDLYSRREVISYSVKDKNPSLVMINNEIDLVAANLKENLSSLVNNSKIALSNLDRRIMNMKAQLQAYPKTEQELMDIKRSFDLNNELYTYLLKRRAEAAIQHASNVPEAQILDQAEEDTTIKTGPKLGINLALGSAAGFAIPLIIIMIISYFNDRINAAEEIEKLSSIQVVGNIVHNAHKKEPIPALKYPRSALAESLRELRTNLRFLSHNDNSKVISVNSVIPKEGKSFLSVNLASIIAINNMKVLLIDCDLRKPSLHKYFGCKNYTGLSSYLIAQNEKEDIIQQTKIDNLSLISAGPIPPNPSEILETGRLKDLFLQARANFDYIVFDNAPLSLVADGIITSQFADVSLFVLRQDYSTKGEVRFINHMNSNKSMKNAGIILNDIQTRKYSQVGSYGSKYSYKHSYGYDYYLESN